MRDARAITSQSEHSLLFCNSKLGYMYIWVYEWILDWTLPTVNVMYTRSQNYTNMVVGEHGIQTFKVALVVLLLLLLLFDVLVPQVHIPYCFSASGLSKYT